MTTKWIVAFLVGVVGGVGVLAKAEGNGGELEKGFVSPPASARPWVYWFWLDGNITREGITADLEAMNRVGIGGVIIMEVNEGTPKGANRFFSGQWRELFKFTLQEAKRLGMEVNMTNSAGWTGSGGPWIGPELAMQKLVWSEAEVESAAGSLAEEVEVKLKTPEATLGFYRDVAVLAVPKVEGGKSVKELSPRITTGPREAKGDLLKLIDGDLKKGVDLPRPEKDSGAQWVQFEFNEPFAARSMHATFGWARNHKCQGEVQVSDNGKEFNSVAKFEGQVPGVTVTFPKAVGRVFRVVFTLLDSRVKLLRVGEIELSENVRLADLEGKTALTTERNISDGPRPATEAGQAVERKLVVDLTKQMKPDGTVSWKVPGGGGKWTILRIGYTPTGKDNHPAPEEGHGLESDKLSREATDVHFNALMGKLIGDAGELAGAGGALTATHIDSWEVGSQNWTPKFREEFSKRRGYDPLPFLPVVTGRIVDSVEVSERFLFDWRQTISDLIAENYFGRVRELAHEHGMRFTLEPYHGPFDEVTCGGRCDEPM